MTTTRTAGPSLRDLAVGDLEQELRTTRRLLERVPDEHLDWKPHPKSMSLGSLATHIANLLFWQTTTVQQSEFDLAGGPPPLASLASREELLRRFDENAAALKQAVSAMDDAALGEPWTLRRGEQTLLRLPRAAVLRTMGISHIIHHRGQLSVYLRLLDVPLPPIYGPTADEQNR
jgi:uncharacterized damage-inducible protein DinB